MKILVCYPMKSLAKTYLPASAEALVAETTDEFYRFANLYHPDTAILFSEMFTDPVWEWLPVVKATLPADSRVIIIPLYRDEWLIRKVLQEKSYEGVYLLSAKLSQEEIRDQVSQILLVENSSAPLGTQTGNGCVFSLMSYGGSGVTTFCINFPVLLARQLPAASILVLDMNYTKPDLSRFFKLRKHQLALFRPDFVDVKTARNRNWKRVCKQSEHMPNLYYADAAVRWKSAEISTMMTVFREQFDYVYLDWGYCFSEPETINRVMTVADRNILFARADPFSLENAREWVRAQRKRGVESEILLSHLDKGQPYRIGEEISLYGVLPRISETRLMQSQKSSSVLIEEWLPPKIYLSSLQKIAKAEYSAKGTVLSG